jgi:hypothetical protein
MLKSNLFPLTVTSMIVLVFGGLIHADTIPGRWEKVDSRPAGTTLLIALKSGGTAEYSFKNMETNVGVPAGHHLPYVNSMRETDDPSAERATSTRWRWWVKKSTWVCWDSWFKT